MRMTNRFHENQRCLVSLLRSAHHSVSVMCAIKIIDCDYYYLMCITLWWCTSLEVETEKRAEISRAGRMVSFIVFMNIKKKNWFNNKKLTPRVPRFVLRGGDYGQEDLFSVFWTSDQEWTREVCSFEIGMTFSCGKREGFPPVLGKLHTAVSMLVLIDLQKKRKRKLFFSKLIFNLSSGRSQDNLSVICDT